MRGLSAPLAKRFGKSSIIVITSNNSYDSINSNCSNNGKSLAGRQIVPNGSIGAFCCPVKVFRISLAGVMLENTQSARPAL